MTQIGLVVWGFVTVAAGISSLPGTLELLTLTLGAMLPPRRSAGSGNARVAVVVPAHNEQNGIPACIRSLLDCEPLSPRYAVIVVADNCTDETADAARAAGARVLVRHDEDRRGKGFALDFAFSTLLPEGFDIFVIVDADTVVSPNLIGEFRNYFASGADAVQCPYRVRNPGASMRTRLMNVALLAFNVLRPRGRANLGLSAGILGNGFALSRSTLTAVPYEATSVVEDLEYHLRLVRSGRSVRFAAATAVYGEMPEAEKGARSQRARWEGGRFRMLSDFGPALSREVLRGRLRLLEPLLDLLLLPLAFHVLLLAVALTAPAAAVRTYAAFGICVVGLHVLTALKVGGGGMRDLLALAAAPFYVLWKLAMIPLVWRTSQRNAEWVRTARASSGDAKP